MPQGDEEDLHQKQMQCNQQPEGRNSLVSDGKRVTGIKTHEIFYKRHCVSRVTTFFVQACISSLDSGSAAKMFPEFAQVSLHQVVV